MTVRNIGASVRAKLLHRARTTARDFNHLLTRYVIERLLYRIGVSAHRSRFWLKGALLFDLWFDMPHRPTRDVDLLGSGPPDMDDLVSIFHELCSIEVQDGVTFLADSVVASEIRKEARYAGIRIQIVATIDGARCPLQIDVGFGDAVTPGPVAADYPVQIPDFPAPTLLVYPRYSVVAEKFEAMTILGIANSRMKDYFDVWFLARQSDFEGDTLRLAIQATFERRGTTLTGQLPFGLTRAFAEDAQKQTQWAAFLRKNRLEAHDLDRVVDEIASFLAPVIERSASGQEYLATWPASGPWSG